MTDGKLLAKAASRPHRALEPTSRGEVGKFSGEAAFYQNKKLKEIVS